MASVRKLIDALEPVDFLRKLAALVSPRGGRNQFVARKSWRYQHRVPLFVLGDHAALHPELAVPAALFQDLRGERGTLHFAADRLRPRCAGNDFRKVVTRRSEPSSFDMFINGCKWLPRVLKRAGAEELTRANVKLTGALCSKRELAKLWMWQSWRRGVFRFCDGRRSYRRRCGVLLRRYSQSTLSGATSG